MCIRLREDRQPRVRLQDSELLPHADAVEKPGLGQQGRVGEGHYACLAWEIVLQEAKGTGAGW